MRSFTMTPAGRRQWAGCAAGAVLIVASLAEMLVTGLTRLSDLLLLLFIAAFAGGIIAGALSRGGARAGAISGLLSGVFGGGVIGFYLVVQSSLAAANGSRFVAGLALLVLALFEAVVLPAAIVGGALGGSLGRSARPRAAKADL